MDISVYELANALAVSRSQINDLVRGLRAITADIARRLSRYFKTSPELWVILQTQYDLEIPQRTAHRLIEPTGMTGR